MKRKILLSVLILLFSFFIIGQGAGSAQTFVDDFNSQAYFDNNWNVLFPTWTITSGTANGLGGTASAANGQSFYNAGLIVESVFKVDQDMAQIFFSAYYDNDLEDWDGYGVDIDDRYPFWGIPTFSVQTWALHDGTHEYAWVQLPGLDLSQFYTVRVIVNETINAYLLNEDGTIEIARLEGVPLKLSATSGMVGMSTDIEATYESFYMEGNPVPIPGAVWLLGSGLVGLAGFRRKKFKK